MMSAPNDDVGPQAAHLLAERDRVGARMPALHALQDQVVAGLQRQMQMRHQPRLAGDGIEQIGVGLDRVDRGEAQPRQLRHVPQDLLDQRAERRRARQIRAVAGEVDAGQHDLAHSRRSTSGRTCATTAPIGTERELPRPKG